MVALFPNFKRKALEQRRAQLIEEYETARGKRDGEGLVTIQDANRHVVSGVKLWAGQHNVSLTPTLP